MQAQQAHSVHIATIGAIGRADHKLPHSLSTSYNALKPCHSFFLPHSLLPPFPVPSLSLALDTYKQGEVVTNIPTTHTHIHKHTHTDTHTHTHTHTPTHTGGGSDNDSNDRLQCGDSDVQEHPISSVGPGRAVEYQALLAMLLPKYQRSYIRRGLC